MSISFDELIKLLKSVNPQTFRGKAPPGSFLSVYYLLKYFYGKKIASSKTAKLMPLYQGIFIHKRYRKRAYYFRKGSEKDSSY